VTDPNAVFKLSEALRSRRMAFTPSSGELLNYTGVALGSSVNPVTSIAGKDKLAIFTPVRQQAEAVAEQRVPEKRYARTVGVTFRNFENDPIPEWRMSQGNEGVLIPGVVTPAEFLRKAEQGMIERHNTKLSFMVAQGRSRSDINEANAKHERNIVRLRTGHRPTIANAIGAMGFPAAVAPEQNALVIAQPHYVESIRRFDPIEGAWVEADDRSVRVVGSHMNDEGRQGPILESQGEEFRPFWAEDNPENK
jgi:hypothetical protein